MNTLRLGSTGADVQTLQTGLNLLPSELLQLAVDGIFGPKTFERVKEYQALARIAVDGVVGPQTWNALQLVLGALGRIVTVNRLRDQVVSVAKKEAEGPGLAVHAKAPGAFDSSNNPPAKPGALNS
jgi:peptidoglycan hydrolase-like protein with peptidoglycan-binding domain